MVTAILTPKGNQSVLEAISSGGKINIQNIILSDYNGVLGALKTKADLNVLHEQPIDSILRSKENPGQIEIKTFIGWNVGNFNIETLGFTDDEDNLIAVSRVDKFFKEQNVSTITYNTILSINRKSTDVKYSGDQLVTFDYLEERLKILKNNLEELESKLITTNKTFDKYYFKTETYNKTEVDNLYNKINNLTNETLNKINKLNTEIVKKVDKSYVLDNYYTKPQINYELIKLGVEVKNNILNYDKGYVIQAVGTTHYTNNDLINFVEKHILYNSAIAERKVKQKTTSVCTCNCNFSNCTCQCNYSCTCNCNYSCTCNCNYANNKTWATACPSNKQTSSCNSHTGINACSCQCNYNCTCNCNYSCTCNCNYMGSGTHVPKLPPKTNDPVVENKKDTIEKIEYEDHYYRFMSCNQTKLFLDKCETYPLTLNIQNKKQNRLRYNIFGDTILSSKLSGVSGFSLRSPNNFITPFKVVTFNILGLDEDGSFIVYLNSGIANGKEYNFALEFSYTSNNCSLNLHYNYGLAGQFVITNFTNKLKSKLPNDFSWNLKGRNIQLTPNSIRVYGSKDFKSYINQSYETLEKQCRNNKFFEIKLTDIVNEIQRLQKSYPNSELGRIGLVSNLNTYNCKVGFGTFNLESEIKIYGGDMKENIKVIILDMNNGFEEVEFQNYIGVSENASGLKILSRNKMQKTTMFDDLITEKKYFINPLSKQVTSISF